MRITSLQALGEIAAAQPEQAETIIPALLDGLADGEGVVRAAATRSLGTLAANAGTHRDEIIQRLRERTTDNNPLVAAAAKDVLETARVPKSSNSVS